MPLGDVLRWALMGTEERISAHTALRLGLVTEVVERDALWDRAHEIAATIAARNPRQSRAPSARYGNLLT